MDMLTILGSQYTHSSTAMLLTWRMRTSSREATAAVSLTYSAQRHPKVSLFKPRLIPTRSAIACNHTVLMLRHHSFTVWNHDGRWISTRTQAVLWVRDEIPTPRYKGGHATWPVWILVSLCGKWHIMTSVYGENPALSQHSKWQFIL